jgi:hypothetical protein
MTALHGANALNPATPGPSGGSVDQPAPLRAPVTVRLAPRREPPFDDELNADERPARHLRAVRPADPPLPFEPWPGRLAQPRGWSAPCPSGRAELPDPVSWSRRLLVAMLEARAGQRPMRQLANHFSPSVHAGLMAESGQSRWSGDRGPAVVRSVHVCEPADGVAEVSAVIQSGARYRAIAARLEGLDGRWCCVRLQLG